jgi:hypothetical protein
MNRKTRKLAVAFALPACLIVAATAYANAGVRSVDMNGVKHAVKSDGSLKPNAVGHLQLKSHIVSCEKLTFDLKNALCKGAFATAGANVKNGADGQNGVSGVDGKNGADGLNGVDGAPGPQGEPGQNGADGTSVFADSYVLSESFVVPAGGHNDHTTSCNTGDLAVGGGFSFSLNEQGFSRVLQNRMDWSQAAQTAATAAGKAADANPDGWYVEVTGGDNDAKGYVWVTCLAS